MFLICPPMFCLVVWNSSAIRICESHIVGGRTYRERGSRIRSIGTVELISATNGIIKLKLDTIYRLDFSGFIGSFQDYNIPINAYFYFDIENGNWVYRSMENINSNDITVIRR